MRALTPLEARVLGVLFEKQHTVPDTYPLSLNALTLGCNQKTARVPVMEATEAEVLTAIDGLKSLSLVFEGSGSRVVKYEHNLPRVLGLPGAGAALLATLMLRGPQTPGELRINTERLHRFADISSLEAYLAELRLNCERLHRFADISSVEGFLDELATKEPPKVVKLPRGAGERESRWAHLLCGEVAMPAAAAGPEAVGAGELAALKAELTRQGQEIAALRALVDRLASELGIQ